MKSRSFLFFLVVSILSVNIAYATPKTEARLLWVSRWMYSNENDVRNIIRKAKEDNFNILLFQVRGNATVYYKSSIEPMDEQIGGDTCNWDPLAVAVDEAKKQGIQLHAWVNVFPAWRGRTPPKNPKQLWNTHPEWFCVNKDGKPMPLGDEYEVLSPGIPAVQDYLYSVFMELVTKYNVDGLHFDYVRYYGPEYSYDSISLVRFKEQYNATPDQNPAGWDDFRRQQITDLIKRVYEGMKKVKPQATLSAAVWGEWAEGRNGYLQDSHGWLSQGIIDFICPMEYSANNTVYDNWTKGHMMNTHGRYIFPGLGIYMYNDPKIMLQQMEINKKYPNSDGTVGYTFFDWTGLYKENGDGTWTPTPMLKALTDGPFKEPALVPEMSWKNSRKSDVVGPKILGIEVTPKVIREGEGCKVSAIISDESGLKEETDQKRNATLVLMNEPFNTKLKWDDNHGLMMGLNKSPTSLITMHQVSPYRFMTEKEITGFKAGNGYFYKIVASDNEGNGNDSELQQLFVYYPTTPYEQKGTFGQSYLSGQFVLLDKQEKVWMCDLKQSSLRIFTPDGIESSISGITNGMNSEKKKFPLKNPSGLAMDSKGMVYTTHGNGSDSYVTKYNPSTGEPVWGMNLKFYPGDLDIDENDNIYIIEKLHGKFHIYDSTGKESPISPISYVTTDASLINRGIAVTRDGETIYIASESVGEILKFQKKISGDKIYYKQVKSLTSVSGASGAVDIDRQGNIYVSDYGKNCIQIFNHNEKHIADIVGGTPELESPRGVAISPDGKNLFILVMSATHGKTFIQKWGK